MFIIADLVTLRNTIRVLNSLDPDQARHFVGPDLGPYSLQRLSTDDTRKQRVEVGGGGGGGSER